MKKKWLAFALCFCMAGGILTGCGKGAGDGKADSAAAGAQAEGNGSAAGAAGGEQSGAAGGEQSGAAGGEQSGAAEALAAQDPAHLELYAVSFGGNNDSLEKVNQAVNDYIKPLINADVKLNILSYGSYLQQVNLMMSGSEQVDLLMSAGSLTATLANQGALQPIDGVLTDYGHGIVDVMGEDVLGGCRYGGQIYGVPTNRDLARSVCYYYRDDINQKYELGLEKAETMEDLEKCFALLQEKAPDISAIGGSNAAVSASTSLFNWEQLDANYAVLLNGAEDLTVSNLYESDTYREYVERMRRWNQAGYIYKEIDTSTVAATDLFATGKFLGFIANGHPGSDNSQSQVLSGPIKHVELVPAYMSSATVQSACWTIPHNSKNPERAMQLLNLMYTDPTLVNLLCYGIEGENYVVKDAEKGIIGYPDGVDSTTKTYDNTLGWVWGNMMIGYIWEGDSPTLYEDMEAFNKNATRSKALGFVFDSSEVQNEVTACSNVVARYAVGLEWGKLDPETTLPTFQQDLRDAGIETIIAAVQEQLDAWAEANGIQ